MALDQLLLDTEIYIDAVLLRLTISDWGETPIGVVYHFEYRSLVDPARPIPVSRTGYLSHFLTAERRLRLEQLQRYALDLAAEIASPAGSEESDQPSLFG